jgi:hypothetical protein
VNAKKMACSNASSIGLASSLNHFSCRQHAMATVCDNPPLLHCVFIPNVHCAHNAYTKK